MPNFRRKSCHQCRSSKLACDRKQPQCSRCERRSWQCRYSVMSKGPLSRANENLQASACAPESPVLDIPTVTSATVSDADELEHTRVGNLFDTADTNDSLRNTSWPEAECCDNNNTIWAGGNFDFAALTSTTDSRFDMSPDIVIDIMDDINLEISKRANFERSSLVDHSLLLRPRRSRTMEAAMTSKMMLGTIRGYPKMLIDSLNLPPFISPPCCDDELRCQESGFHQCLPPPLAACASVVRMSQGDTPENRAVIWRTIHMEQQKLFHEHESYEKETLVAAVQAAILYNILHITEVASVPKDYLNSVAITLDRQYCGKTDGIHSRPEWICNESMWRAVCFCYTLNELLHMAISPSSGNGGSSCRRLQLPSVRSVWSAKSNIEWQRKYANQASRRQMKDCLKIAHLREYAKSSGESLMKEGWMTDVEAWCMDHDDLGTLIWMATKLDPV